MSTGDEKGGNQSLCLESETGDLLQKESRMRVDRDVGETGFIISSGVRSTMFT